MEYNRDVNYKLVSTLVMNFSKKLSRTLTKVLTRITLQGQFYLIPKTFKF